MKPTADSLAFLALLSAITNICLAVWWFFQEKKSMKLAAKQKEEDKFGYKEKAQWNELCWVRALERLNALRSDPEINKTALVLGFQDGGGHAWIEYVRGDDVIQYDPTTNKVITIKNKEKGDK